MSPPKLNVWRWSWSRTPNSSVSKSVSPPVMAPPALNDLVRIREMKLRAVSEAGRTKGELPSANQGLLDGQREEQIGFSNHFVVEEVVDARAEGVGVKRPSVVRNCDAELEFLVALSAKCGESAIVLVAQIDQRSGGGDQRRRLIVVTVESAEGPVQARDGEGCAEARADRVFSESVVARKVRRAHACREGQPGKRLELVVEEKGRETAGWCSRSVNGGFPLPSLNTAPKLSRLV